MITLILALGTALIGVVGYAMLVAKGVTFVDIYFLYLKFATLLSMIFAAIGMFGFRRFFQYVYFLIALSVIMGVLLSATKG
ncbi:MAG: hypothetical protein ACYCVD_04355 [Desulfitobacteriaceae bacterium]